MQFHLELHPFSAYMHIADTRSSVGTHFLVGMPHILALSSYLKLGK